MTSKSFSHLEQCAGDGKLYRKWNLCGSHPRNISTNKFGRPAYFFNRVPNIHGEIYGISILQISILWSRKIEEIELKKELAGNE